jgi:hypothetical protein
MAKKPSNPRLLPPIDYNPQKDDEKQRGGGNYEYYDRANSYASNPAYSQQFGGSGGGYEPPAPQSPPQQDPQPLPPISFQLPEWPFAPIQGLGPNNMIGGGVGGIVGAQGGIAPGNLFGSAGAGAGALQGWLPETQPDNPGMGATVNGLPLPQWGPLATGYKQSPAFLQGRAAGATGALPNQQEQINDWYPQGQPDPSGISGVGNPSIPSGGGSRNSSPVDTRTGATADRSTDNIEQIRAARTQDAMAKNQNLTQQATAAGDTKELERLQAEWDRIAPKAAKYGITAERLINSYMQPGNSAAEPTLDRAMGRAIADDTWAGAATVAFGRPPNQVEWDEHWRAMNKGGRDPLEGHPAAIQQIQARMQQIEQENQDEAYGQYQQWLNSQ